MSDIPTDLFRVILLKVPVEPLFRCRSVCKCWRMIIDDPFFGYSHKNLHRQAEEESQLLVINENCELHSYYVDSLCFSAKRTMSRNKYSLVSLCFSGSSGSCNETIKSKKIKNCIIYGCPRIQTLPMPSCDGLVLISESLLWALWNPFTGESVHLPYHDGLIQGYICPGLGYDLISNDYKVVSFVQCFSKGRCWLETVVYNLKSGKWRRIKDFHCSRLHRLRMKHGVYLDGTLYWIAISMNFSILTFDLGTETYKFLQLPAALSQVDVTTRDELVLNVLGESLFLIHNSLRLPSEVWMKMVDGEQSEWTKIFSSNKYPPKVMAYSKRKGQVLIMYDEFKFVSYDVEKRTIHKLGILDLGVKGLIFQILHPSLLRLRNDDGGW